MERDEGSLLRTPCALSGVFKRGVRRLAAKGFDHSSTHVTACTLLAATLICHDVVSGLGLFLSVPRVRWVYSGL